MIALIPARGGSKRVPGKNIAPFFGHPLIAYAIAAARNAGLFDDVLVSTDSPAIGDIARWYGATYLPRPAALASDSAGLVEVALHALQARPAEVFCLMMPNCPLRRASDVVEQYRTFRQGRRLFQISAVPYRGVYPHWAMTMDKTGRGGWLFGDKFKVRSQTLATAVCPTGAAWWIRSKDFTAQKNFYGKPFHLAPMDASRGLDIDHPEELELAEILARGLKARDGKSALEPIARRPYIKEKTRGA